MYIYRNLVSKEVCQWGKSLEEGSKGITVACINKETNVQVNNRVVPFMIVCTLYIVFLLSDSRVMILELELKN